MISCSMRVRRSPWRRAGAGLALAILGWNLAIGGAADAMAASPTNAAEGKERDLGQGLAYYRIHALPLDLPPPESGKPPVCVVDLRYVRASRDEATAFRNWAGRRAAVRPPVLVLVNGGTDGDLLAVLRTHEWGGSVMTIGIPTRSFQPDIAVEATPAEEKAAYDAFENGATIASLTTDYPGKIRYDETSLGKDRRADQPARPANEARDAVARHVDPTLQRAVHLHRALVALKKL